MLRYSPDVLDNFRIGRSTGFYPFPGRYPTRIWATNPESRWEYFGKPTVAAWREIIRRTWLLNVGPRFVEFDRRGIVRQRISDEVIMPTYDERMMRRYYFMNSEDFLVGPLEMPTYLEFSPIRLREGTMYVRPTLKDEVGWTQEHYLSLIRKRLRGDIRNYRTRPPQPPVEPPLQAVLEVFQRLAKDARPLPPAVNGHLVRGGRARTAGFPPMTTTTTAGPQAFDRIMWATAEVAPEPTPAPMWVEQPDAEDFL